MGFWSANIQRYYTGQPLIEQLSSVCGQTTVKRGRMNGGKVILSLYIFTCLCILSRPADSTKYVRLLKISIRTERLPV